jgi:putative nucleotidyltransferase with HDIG domain
MSLLLARHPAKKCPPASAVREAVLRDLDRPETYPTLSDTTVRAVALMACPDVSVSELAGIIRRDAFVTAAVLRRANSCAFRGSSAIREVSPAIVRLGLRECGKLVCTVGLRALYDRLDPGVRRACDALHRHSVFVACLAAQLNGTFDLGHSTLAFTAGLLHDVGRVIACAKAPGRFAAADPLDHCEDAGLLRREREQLGIDHCTIGHQFADRNRLPGEIARVILNHHRPEEETLKPELVGLVALADGVANFASREHRIAGYDPDTCPGFRTLSADWNFARKAGVRRRLPGVVVAALRETRTILKCIF